MNRQEIEARLRDVIIGLPRKKKIDPATIAEASTFCDLGLDSLDSIEVVMGAEDAFEIDIDDDEAEAAKSFGQLVNLIAGKLSVPA